MKKLLIMFLINAASLFSQKLYYYYDSGVDSVWENSITNSEFTTDLSGWAENSTPVTFEWLASYAGYSGVLHIATNDGNQGAIQTISLEVGATYKLRFKYDYPVGGVCFRVGVFDGTEYKVFDENNNAGEYFAEYTFVATQSPVNLFLVHCGGWGGATEVYFDYCYLEKLISP